MTQTRLLFILAFFLLTAFRCSKEEDLPPIEYPAPVSSVFAPATGTVGQDISIEITYTLTSSCAQFGRLVVEENGETYNMFVYPKYEGSPCEQILRDQTTYHTFTPTRKGFYLFRFWQGPEQYLTKTIEVQ
jgi:hypothetical protein